MCLISILSACDTFMSSHADEAISGNEEKQATGSCPTSSRSLERKSRRSSCTVNATATTPKWRRVHGEKKRGKWTRSNLEIGGVGMEEATKLAVELTGQNDVDLRLPTWSEVCPEWRRFDWMSADDVVTRRVLCLLCQQNVLQPAFVHHMKTEHPDEHADVHEVLRRLSEVRTSRFYNLSVVGEDELSYLDGSADREGTTDMRKFLISCGFIIRPVLREEDEPKVKDKVGRAIERPAEYVDFSSVREESCLKHIAMEDARDIATVVCEEGGALTELEFSSSYTLQPLGKGGDERKPLYKRTYCYSCQLMVSDSILDLHVKKRKYHTLFHPTPQDGPVSLVLRRLTEVRLWKYFSANPVPLWKVRSLAEVTNQEEEILIDFLKYRGFAINMFATESPDDTAWPPPFISLVDSGSTSCPPSPSRSCSSPCWSPAPSDIPSSTYPSSDSEGSTHSTLSHSAASTSSGSRSRSPSLGSGERCEIPYSVMNQVHKDSRVDHAILDVETYLELDENNALEQAQYMFVMGWAMYSLVVTNGCKLNVLSRLTHGDVSSAKEMKDSGLRIMCFSTNSTSSKANVFHWITVDEHCWRALQLFLVAKERRATQMDCLSSVTHSMSAFFVSFNLKALRGNDVDYPLSQFLRMCSVPWKFRSGHLSAAVDDLVVRDPKKRTAEYALEIQKQLRGREQHQIDVLGMPEKHPLIEGMEVNVDVKQRKDKGTIKGPMGPNRTFLTKIQSRKRSLFNVENDRLAVRVRGEMQRKERFDKAERREKRRSLRLAREQAAEKSKASGDDTCGEEGDRSRMTKRARASTPETAGSPSRAFAETPSPDASSSSSSSESDSDDEDYTYTAEDGNCMPEYYSETTYDDINLL